MNLFVGSLAKEVTTEDLRQTFEPFGKVESASVVFDRNTNQSRGFGFVEMPCKAEARKAIDELSGRFMLKGKVIMINEARPREGGHGGSRGGGRRRF
jgi:RNA recognition motif-containing protein